MAARVQKKIALLVISLIVAVISLPMTAAAISMPTWASPQVAVGSELRAPIRIAVAADGSFYVSDPRHGGVLKYNPAGLLIKRITTSSVPQAIALLPNGNLVVTQSAFGYSYAAIIDSVSGLEIKRLNNGTVEYDFGFADGVTVDNGVGNPGSVPYIYVVDVLSLTLKVFNSSTGAFVSEFSVRGAPEGTNALAGIPTSVPTFVAFEKRSGLLAVVDRIVLGDSTGRNIRFYNKSGVVVSKFGLNGPAGYDSVKSQPVYTSPQSIAFQYNDNGTIKRMYVVDTYNSTVQVDVPSGDITGATTYSLAGFMGDYGTDGNKGELYLPVDGAFDQLNKRLLVVNGNGNVVIYGVDGGTTPVVTPPAAPELSLTAVSNIVNTTSIDIAGTVTPGSKISCVLNGMPIMWGNVGTVVTDGKVSWTCNGIGTLVADNQIMVVAQNDSPTSDVETVNVKYIENGPSLRVNPFADYVNNPVLTLSGDTDATSLRVCNAVPLNCSDAVINAGAWTMPTGITLQAGDNRNITIEATKGAVQTVETVHNVVLDAVAPKLKVSVVADNAIVSDQIQNITGQVSDPENHLQGVTIYSYDAAGTHAQSATTVKDGYFSAAMSGVTSFNIVARDLAGNEKWYPGPDASVKSSINYDPNKVKLTLTSADIADASVVTVSNGLMLSGTMSSDLSSLQVKGVAAQLDHANLTWTAPITIDYDSVTKDGLNDIQIVASDGSRMKATIIYDPANPEATIVEPKMDVATNSSQYTLTVMDGTAVILTTTFQGHTDVVASLAPFTVGFDAEGSYPVILSANDSNGAYSQVVRNIVYDKTAPSIIFTNPNHSVQCEYDINGVLIPGSCVSTCPSGVCSQASYSGTIEAGAKVYLVNASDNNALADVATYSNSGRTWTVDTASRDPYSTVVVATDAAGNVKRSFAALPDGNMNVDTAFNMTDVNTCMSKVSSYGPRVAPDYPGFAKMTPQQLAHGDIAPLSATGSSNPDGYIDIVDCLLMVRKLNGYSVPF